MRPYNPPVATCIRCFKPVEIGCTCTTGPGSIVEVDWTDNHTAGMNPPTWKPIGEAASDLMMSIERIDGYRVPVSRFFPVINNQININMAEIENRISRDILRDSFRSMSPWAYRD